MLPRIVLVDDQPEYRAVVRALVSEGVHIVAEAGNAEEAMLMVDEHRPDGVVMDVNLGQVNGFHLAKALTERHPHLRILLTSAFAERVYAEYARRIPGASFISKSELNGRTLAMYFKS